MKIAVDDNSLREQRRLLGLRPNPSVEDINTAFRRLSKDAHPDAGGSLDRFTALQHARNVLLEAADTRQSQLYFRSPRRSGRATWLDRQPLWLPGAFVTLFVGVISALVSVVQVDRQILAIGFSAAVVAGIVVTVATAIGRNVRSRRRVMTD